MGMFAHAGNGEPLHWTVLNASTRVVRESGTSSTLADCIAQALEGEEVFIGASYPQGVMLLPDGTVVENEKAVDETGLPTAANVKLEAARRLRHTDWAGLRALEQPDHPDSEAVLAARALIRQRSNEIEAMNPIPDDFRNSRYWE